MLKEASAVPLAWLRWLKRRVFWSGLKAFRGGFKHFFNFTVIPIWGKDPIWLINIFQMGWNHQYDMRGEILENTGAYLPEEGVLHWSIGSTLIYSMRNTWALVKEKMCSTRFSQRLTFGGWTARKVENTRLNSTFQDEEGDETIRPRVGSSITNRSPPTIWGQIWFCGSGFVWELTSFGIVGDLRTWSFPAPTWSCNIFTSDASKLSFEMMIFGLTVWSSLWWLGSFWFLCSFL